MTTKTLHLGCTKARHAQLGIDAVVNARGGRQDLNDLTERDRALRQDARGIRDYQQSRVRWYGPHSRFFVKHRARVEHLIAGHDD